MQHLRGIVQRDKEDRQKHSTIVMSGSIRSSVESCGHPRRCSRTRRCDSSSRDQFQSRPQNWLWPCRDRHCCQLDPCSFPIDSVPKWLESCDLCNLTGCPNRRQVGLLISIPAQPAVRLGSFGASSFCVVVFGSCLPKARELVDAALLCYVGLIESSILLCSLARKGPLIIFSTWVIGYSQTVFHFNEWLVGVLLLIAMTSLFSLDHFTSFP